VPSKRDACLEELTKLKGVGPATASAIMSMLNPQEEPFFSDELSGWLWARGHDQQAQEALKKDEKPNPKGKSKSRPKANPIKLQYTLKFYKEFLQKVKNFQEELKKDEGLKDEWRSLDVESIERAAWTFWNAEKFGVDLGSEGGDEKKVQEKGTEDAEKKSSGKRGNEDVEKERLEASDEKTETSKRSRRNKN